MEDDEELGQRCARCGRQRPESTVGQELLRRLRQLAHDEGLWSRVDREAPRALGAAPMMGEDELLGCFERVQRHQGGWMVLCPAHADRNPSLHITRAEGRWLFHCHAGCEAEAVLGTTGLDWSDLSESNGNGNGHREVVAEYDYADESGKLLFQVVRFAPKDFRQRKPDGAGGWEWKLGNTRRVLYRLPKVLEAVKDGRTVWIVEGEKDVHALEKAGVVATCNAGGAGKWRDEYADCLRGAKVAVIADRDEPGRAHARQVAESLEGVAATVKVGEPAEGKDAADHLKAGRGA